MPPLANELARLICPLHERSPIRTATVYTGRTRRVNAGCDQGRGSPTNRRPAWRASFFADSGRRRNWATIWRLVMPADRVTDRPPRPPPPQR
jgi:hypothetical protein